MTIQSYPNGNPPNTPIGVKAVLTGNVSTNGHPEFTLYRMIDNSVLVASSYEPLTDACRALRLAHESAASYVQVLTARADGVYVPAYGAQINYGLSMLGPYPAA